VTAERLGDPEFRAERSEKAARGGYYLGPIKKEEDENDG